MTDRSEYRGVTAVVTRHVYSCGHETTEPLPEGCQPVTLYHKEVCPRCKRGRLPGLQPPTKPL